MIPPISRVQKGVPTGGQFAATQLTESDLVLDAETVTGPDAATVAEFADNGMTATAAKEWTDRNFDAAHALDWAAEGHTPSDAHEWTGLGVEDPKIANRWGYAGPGTTSPDRARPWIEAGFGNDDIDEADGWSGFGFEARDAGLWRAAGFEHHEATAWAKAGYQPGDSIGLRAEGFDPSKLSPTLHRTGRAPFKIANSTRGVIYEMRTVSETDAADHGCPGATHLMVGEHESRYGRLEPVSGKRVNVPGWTSERKGVSADFVCDQDPDFEPLRGYLGE